MALMIDDRGVILACASCGQRNRVPFGREAKCAKCGTSMPALDQPLDVPTATAFDARVRDAPVPVVVDFWAPWCGPCRMVAPEIARVAASHAGRWLVAKVNTEALPDVAGRFRIQSIPTMAVFTRGKEAARTLGARPAHDIEDFVNSVIGLAS
jgi:thioredoxin 2